MSVRFLVFGLLVLVCACAGHRAGVARLAPDASLSSADVSQPPQPAEGLWAMLDPGCAKPSAADFRAWPHCASPFWINGHKAMVIDAVAVGRRAVGGMSYEADYSFTPGYPLIAQVGTQKDGYLFLALTDLARDDRGQLVGAVGAAVSCAKPTGEELALKPSENGCDGAHLDELRKAALATLQDRAALTKVAWIAPGAP